MRKITNTDIYVWVHNCYKNPVIPTLADLITGYLIEHPDKLDYYFNENITLPNLISHLADSYSKNKDMNLLDEIKLYMEG